MWKLDTGVLRAPDGTVVMEDVPETVAIQMDPRGVGVFLRITGEKNGWWKRAVGRPCVKKWMACHRYEPFWMKPAVGEEDGSRVPVETQVLFGEMEDRRVAIWVPLVDGATRCVLEGSEGGALALVAETGGITGRKNVGGLFVAIEEPGGLGGWLERAAETVAKMMGTGVLRRDKAVPAFVDLFGWCTWDAFYQEVSPEKVREGLESFRRGGITPKFLILDDGWQSEEEQGEARGRRLTSLSPNAKFGGDLTGTVRMAKDEFGVQQFLVWHALQGYWGGVDGAKLPFEVHETPRNYSAGVLHYWPEANTKWWGAIAGVVAPKHIGKFFNDYHAALKAQGVDGVKVDNQAALEGMTGGAGRVAMYRAYREALEASARAHFSGNLVNCMSCANDILYGLCDSTLTRTSTDFWPSKPETHGLHLWTNAVVGLWFGHFVLPDWDMFQSGLPGGWGTFHAAGRAISGGPVYVSDKPGEHDVELLRKLVLSDGTILRCDGPGVVARETLFCDVLREEVLLKVWNTNGGGRSGVVGVFNCRYGGGSAVAGSISPSDVERLASHEQYVVYLHRAGMWKLGNREMHVHLALQEGQWEVATIVPVAQGAAVVGLVDKMNGGGAVERVKMQKKVLRIQIRDGGTLGMWCAVRPERLACAGRELKWEWEDGWLRARVDGKGEITVTWV